MNQHISADIDPQLGVPHDNFNQPDHDFFFFFMKVHIVGKIYHHKYRPTLSTSF